MKRLVAFFIVLTLAGCEWTLDVCNYERVFNNCMNTATQTGVSSTNFVSQCSDVAHNASMRHKTKVKPECQK